MKNALGSVDSVLLLGGRSEIGLAIVRRLVASGARRVVLATRGEVDERAVAALKDSGAQLVESVDFDGDLPDTHGAVIDEAFDR
ncbi:MAG: KR domain-containing protein, partial [Actinomycetota bacterium]|nr:KR domain-containing protein [Actinomycetota bacterium]